MKTLLFGLIIVLFSCTKVKQFDGCVLDSAGNPVPNAIVELSVSRGLKSDIIATDQFKTNSKGIFVHRFNNRNVHGRKIESSVPGVGFAEKPVNIDGESNIILQLK